MPRLDRTGPEGVGPMTGRGLGRCKTDSEDVESRGFFERVLFRNRRQRPRGRGIRRRTPRNIDNRR